MFIREVDHFAAVIHCKGKHGGTEFSYRDYNRVNKDCQDMKEIFDNLLIYNSTDTAYGIVSDDIKLIERDIPPKSKRIKKS